MWGDHVVHTSIEIYVSEWASATPSTYFYLALTLFFISVYSLTHITFLLCKKKLPVKFNRKVLKKTDTPPEMKESEKDEEK